MIYTSKTLKQTPNQKKGKENGGGGGGSNKSEGS